jgi:hypothetical protein
MIPFLLWALGVAGAALVLTQSSLTAPLRSALDRAAGGQSFGRHPARVLAKLTACPMCSGFWIGALFARLFHVVAPHELAAHAFAGSLASALAVQAWLWLGETAAAAGLWRYLHTPPAGVHHERSLAAAMLGQSPNAIRCPRPDCEAVGGKECVFR